MASDDTTTSADASNNNSSNQPLVAGNSPLEEGAAAAAEKKDFMARHCMRITDEEREFALAIKRAVEDDEDLVRLTDLDYLQYALSTNSGDLDETLRKIRGLQVFRQEYQINDTLEQGIDLLHALLQQQPGMLLSVDKVRTSPKQPNEEDNDQLEIDLHSHYLMVFDFAKINPRAMKLPSDKRDLLGALYYVHHATQTNPNAIRNGILFIAECDSMSWDNISLDFVGPIWAEMKNYYPVNLKEISWLRAATAATVMFNLAKPFLPLHVRQKVNLGCEFQAFDGRLDELFMT